MSNARNLANFKPSASGQVEAGDIADDAVGIAQLSATGTPSSSTFLRGDNSWQSVPSPTPGGSNTYVQYNNAGSFGGSANFVFDGTNVGIGTSSPTTQLSIIPSAGGTNLNVKTRAYLGATYSSDSLVLGYSVKADTASVDRMVGTETNSGGGAPAAILMNSGAIQFHTNSSITSGAAFSSERFRIGSSGQLGIGGANYGTSGQVLTSAGSGAAPSWQTPGGAWALVGSGSFSNSSSVGISNFSSTYDNYCIVLENVMSSSAGHSLYMGINISGYGYLSDFKASSYAWSGTSTTWSNSGNYAYDGLIAQYLRRYSDETNSFGYRVIVWLLDTNNTTNKKGAIGTFGGVNNGLETQSGHFACWGNDTTGTVAAVRFTSNQGASNLYGKYQIYGIKTS